MSYSVEWHEEAGSPKSTLNEGEFYSVRRLRCAWADRVTLINELNTGTNLQYPYPDGTTAALIRRIDIENDGRQSGKDENDRVSYVSAVLNVHYSTRGPVLLGDFLVTERLEPNTFTIPIPNQAVRWGDGTSLPDRFADNVATINSFSYVWQLHDALVVPTWLSSRIGTCNFNTVVATTLGYSFAPGTLRYTPGVIQTSYRFGQIIRYDVVVRYEHNPFGWNNFYRSDTGTWEPLYLADGTLLIPYTPVVYSGM